MRSRQHLVVVLPGIGGSVLARKGEPDDVVWDAGLGDIADLVFRSDRMSVSESPHLEPIGLTRSTKFAGFTVVPGYERLLDQLSEYGPVDRRGDPEHPVRDADVIAVPYDFRGSIVEAAERLDAVVCAHLDGVDEAERTARVIVVAHSLGGLVARYWMAMGPAPRWLWCRALITLGTPHRGAPKALNWLVNGVRLGGVVRLRKPSALLWDWPSVMQLLPRYPAVRNLVGDAAWYPHQLPVDGLAGPARAAYDLHVELERLWGAMPRSGPETVACIGWSHPTPDAAFWDGRALRVTKEPPDWLELGDRWSGDFGDGSVPAVSALPAELDSHVSSPVRLVDRHVPMAGSERVLELVQRYEAYPRATRVHGDEGGERVPAFGVDVEELQIAGEPIGLTVAVREVDADLSGQAVWARLEGAAGRASVRLDWDAGQGRFTGLFAGMPQGLYDLRVRAREVPGVGDLETVDTIAVVDGG